MQGTPKTPLSSLIITNHKNAFTQMTGVIIIITDNKKLNATVELSSPLNKSEVRLCAISPIYPNP